jgi:hypothetical protein
VKLPARKAATAAMAIAALCGQAAAATRWQGLGGDAQHTAIAPAPAQTLNRILWTTPIDLDPQLNGGELLIHYGSPMVTPGNTLILPVKTGATDGFRVEARVAATGALIWSMDSDYQLPAHDWTPSYGPVLTKTNRLYYPGGGGIIRYRGNPDHAQGTTGFIAFYGNAAYLANVAGYRASVKITTPLTADGAGNIYFGFIASGSAPGGLVSGIARVGADGAGTWVSAATAAGDSGITEVQTNCAPAISHDQQTVYVAVSNGPNNSYSGYLVGLDAATLAPKYKVFLKDPSNGDDAEIDDDSTASPSILPNGDVFMGVLARQYPYHNARGWLLHFNATLSETKLPGSFGWDNTPSVLPASAVPSYTGKSQYLVMSKYNNYAGFGTGNGHNEIAILDPLFGQLDSYSPTKVHVMKEVLTIAGPTPFPGGGPGQTYEWCLDSAAVDPATNSAFANSEDGHLYRWDLKTNTISQHILLNAPRPEAYTPTVVGVDGTVYAINNATFYAVGN